MHPEIVWYQKVLQSLNTHALQLRVNFKPKVNWKIWFGWACLAKNWFTFSWKTGLLLFLLKNTYTNLDTNCYTNIEKHVSQPIFLTFSIRYKSVCSQQCRPAAGRVCRASQSHFRPLLLFLNTSWTSSCFGDNMINGAKSPQISGRSTHTHTLLKAQ